MDKITVLSLFPQMVTDALSYGIIKRATEIMTIESRDLRKWGLGDYKKVDDASVAPGPGMLFRADVVANAIIDVKKEDSDAYIVHMSPRGTPLSNKKAKELSQKKHLVILASRYEGLDQRVIDNYVDEEISIGDYVLSGGELASLVLIDSVLRMTGNVLRIDAVEEESFQQGLLEYPHYTKPLKFENKEIPKYLRSGNHQLIQDNRFLEQLFVTWLRRPDLLRDYPLCKIDVQNKNPLTKLKKQNILLKKRLNAFEKVIWENRDVRRFKKDD